MTLSFAIENCSSKAVFDILESDHMIINEVRNIPSINLDIAYTGGAVCKSTIGPKIFEFAIYSIITPALVGLLSNWLYDKLKKNNISNIKIENTVIIVNNPQDLEIVLKKYINK